MENGQSSIPAEIQVLQNRVIELERQLASAQAASQALTPAAVSGTPRNSGLLFDHSRDMILFIRREDGRILDANPAALQGYGYSHAELLALTIRDLRAPETRGQIGDQMTRADSQRADAAHGILFETIHQRSDGSTFPVEVSSQGATIDGERILISVVRDITQRKQAESERERLMADLQREKGEALHRAEELSAVIEAMQDPVLVYDRNGIIYRVNASAVRAHGFDPVQQHRSDTNRTLVIRHPDGRPVHSDEMPSALALQGKTVLEEPLVVKNSKGQEMIFLISSSPLVVNGIQLGAVSVWHDVTAQTRAEQALQAQSEALRASEEKYRLFFDQLHETVSVFEAARDEQGSIVDWLFLDVNQAGLQMLGLAREQLVGKPVSQVLGSEIFDRYNSVYSGVLATGTPHFHETIYQDRYFYVTIARLDEKRVASVGLDITERKKAEERLAYQAMLLENIQEAVVATDAARIITVWNRAAEKLYGWPAEEAIGRPVKEIIPAEWTAEQSEMARRDMLEKGGFTGSMAQYARDGRRMWVECHGRALLDSSGQITSLVSVNQDITELKQAQEALAEAHARAAWLARFPDENPSPVLRVSADRRVLYCNQATKALGWACETNQPLDEPLWSLVEQAMGQAQETQQDVAMADRVYSISIMPFPQEHYANLYGRDITERKRVEAALRESEERYRIAVRNAPSVYAQTDRELRYRWIHNPHPDFQPAHVIGKRDDEVEDSEDMRRLVALKRQVLESGVGLRAEWSANRSDGVRIYDMTIEPLRDLAGQIIGVSTAALDITELKQAQRTLSQYAEKLKNSNRELEQFAFVASHDLQEPLRKIIRFGEIVSSQLGPEASEVTRDYLWRMQNAAQRMQAMIDGLLDLSRVSTQGKAFETVSLAQVAEEVLSDLEPRIFQTQGRVELGSLPQIEADPVQMHQLLQNLIGNALKFHKKDLPPVVRVRCEVQQVKPHYPGHVLLSVEDNGIGFEPQDDGRIFRPFGRLHGRGEYEGTGMGLAICQKIVERHHGTITVRSQPGQGAEFIIQLPIRQPAGM